MASKRCPPQGFAIFLRCADGAAVEVVPLAQPKRKRPVKCNEYDRSTFGGCEFFRHKFAVTVVIVCGADPRQTGVHHDI
jgi:hypothetical protein